MDFISVYIREQKRYTKKELLAMFHFNDEEIEKFIRELKSYGILKAVKNDPKQKNLTELFEEDIEITDDTLANEELLYVFTFVGVITFGNRMKTQLDDFVPVYTACGGTKEGAIDYFLAHKILRKLDGKYDAYISDCLDELVEALNENYGENVFEKSLKKIDTVKKRNFGTGE